MPRPPDGADSRLPQSSAPAAGEFSPFSLTGSDGVVVMAMIALAAALRLAFFNGVFGSDDVVYLNRSVEISQGIWSIANYNGALRYGYNIPAGVLIYLFGLNLFTATLWPFLCSLAEIAMVYIFAGAFWGRRSGICAALILTCTPLHVAAATRLHADSVVSFFLSLSFVLFFVAERWSNRAMYFLAGIAMGCVFWVKELAVVGLFGLALYPVFWRRLDLRWVYVIAGGLVMLVAHFALMTVIAGDPLHLFKVVTGQVSQSFIQVGVGEDKTWYYFWYLFVDIKHTWLAPFLAVPVALTLAWSTLRRRAQDAAATYVAFWLIALLAVLSFTPVSVEPVRFVMKQSNYLTLFLAPIAILAGYQLARTRGRTAVLAMVPIVIGGSLLGALEQQAYHVFTSNSKAAVEFSKVHADAQILGSVNNETVAYAYSILESDPAISKRVAHLGDLSVLDQSERPGAKVNKPAFAVLDLETMEWGSMKAVRLQKAPDCWKKVTPLSPTGFGLGRVIVDMILRVVAFLPDSVSRHLMMPLQNIARPRPAIAYSVDLSNLWCGQATNANPNESAFSR